MKKMIVFDMDGTIADLYNVNGWYTDLRAENPRPYAEAEPMYDMAELRELLLQAKAKGFIIAVTTWLAKGSSEEYKEEVRKVKAEWLKRYNFPADEIHMVQYGTPKRYVTKNKAKFQVLVDDNKEVRKDWGKWFPMSINANEDIIPQLKNLIQMA